MGGSVSALEDADEINRFKTESDYVEDVEIASGASHAGDAARRDQLGHGADAAALQQVPVPSLRRSDEQESRNCPRPADSRDEEKRLLDAALQRMNTASIGSSARCSTTASSARWSSCAAEGRCSGFRTNA